MSLHEYISTINKMLEDAKEDTFETSRYIEDLEALFSIKNHSLRKKNN